MWEREVTPPGMDGGGPNDTTTMRNTQWRTRQPKELFSLTTMNYVGLYDPEIYSQLLTVINVNQQIRITYPDTHTLTFWGWLDKMTPNAIVEGAPPTINITIEPSNEDDSGVEAAPTYA
jgi:hypothetical protein